MNPTPAAVADYSPQAWRLLGDVRSSYLPPPALKVSEFADREIVVSSGPLAGTRWSTDFAPYQRGIMDAFHEPGVETVVVKGSSQWGKTAMAVNLCAYHMAHDPCAILVVEPTVDPMAKDFSRNRLEPTIAASPRLSEVVSKKRQKDSSNTTLHKQFRGGSLDIGGANSAASLAARSVRLLILDEVDRYPPELPGEGSTLAVALKRTNAYRRRKRIAMFSSPTLEGATIDAWHQLGDQRRFYVPCPACDHPHPYEWRNVRWQDGDPSTARLHCPACDHAISEAERVAILVRGEWRAEHAERDDQTIVSFHLWEAYSPLSSLEEIVKGFLRARKLQKAGDRREMHTWQNTTLGEAVALEDGDGIEAHALLARRESYPELADCPPGVLALVAGVDVQDDRLEAYIYGFGRHEEAWLIDRHLLPGDTDRREPWDMLDEMLQHQYSLAGVEEKLGITAACIDSAGHRTSIVYDYGLRHAHHRVFVTIGRDGPNRPIVSAPSKTKFGLNQRKVSLYTIGVDSAKALLMSRLKLSEAGPGFIHLPIADWCDQEFAEQLTAEVLRTRWKKGIPTQVWEKRRPRNEALDCTVLAIAALRLANPNFDFLAARLTAKPEPPAPTVPARRPWLGGRRRGWLDRNR